MGQSFFYPPLRFTFCFWPRIHQATKPELPFHMDDHSDASASMSSGYSSDASASSSLDFDLRVKLCTDFEAEEWLQAHGGSASPPHLPMSPAEAALAANVMASAAMASATPSQEDGGLFFGLGIGDPLATAAALVAAAVAATTESLLGQTEAAQMAPLGSPDASDDEAAGGPPTLQATILTEAALMADAGVGAASAPDSTPLAAAAPGDGTADISALDDAQVVPPEAADESSLLVPLLSAQHHASAGLVGAPAAIVVQMFWHESNAVGAPPGSAEASVQASHPDSSSDYSSDYSMPGLTTACDSDDSHPIGTHEPTGAAGQTMDVPGSSDGDAAMGSIAGGTGPGFGGGDEDGPDDSASAEFAAAFDSGHSSSSSQIEFQSASEFVSASEGSEGSVSGSESSSQSESASEESASEPESAVHAVHALADISDENDDGVLTAMTGADLAPVVSVQAPQAPPEAAGPADPFSAFEEGLSLPPSERRRSARGWGGDVSRADSPYRRGRPLNEAADRLRRRGNVAFNKGAVGRAAGFYTRALACDPTDALLHSNRSIALSEMGALHASLADADEAVRLDGSWHRAHARRALALAGLGRHAEAARAYAAAAQAEESEAAGAEGRGGTSTYSQSGGDSGGGLGGGELGEIADGGGTSGWGALDVAGWSAGPHSMWFGQRRPARAGSSSRTAKQTDRPTCYRKLSQQQQRLARRAAAAGADEGAESSTSGSGSGTACGSAAGGRRKQARLAAGGSVPVHTASSSFGSFDGSVGPPAASGGASAASAELSITTTAWAFPNVTALPAPPASEAAPAESHGAAASTSAGPSTAGMPSSLGGAAASAASPGVLEWGGLGGADGWGGTQTPGHAEAPHLTPGSAESEAAYLAFESAEAEAMLVAVIEDASDEEELHGLAGMEASSDSAEEASADGAPALPGLVQTAGPSADGAAPAGAGDESPDDSATAGGAAAADGGAGLEAEDTLGGGVAGEADGGAASVVAGGAGAPWSAWTVNLADEDGLPVWMAQPFGPATGAGDPGGAAGGGGEGPHGPASAANTGDAAGGGGGGAPLQQLMMMGETGLNQLVQLVQQLEGSFGWPERTPSLADDKEILDGAVEHARQSHVAIQTCAALAVHRLATLVHSASRRALAPAAASNTGSLAYAHTQAGNEPNPTVPWELAVVVAQCQLVAGGEAALTSLRHVLCLCDRASRHSFPHGGRLAWAEQGVPTRRLHAVCAECGGTTRLLCTPTMLEPAPEPLDPPSSFGRTPTRHAVSEGRAAARATEMRLGGTAADSAAGGQPAATEQRGLGRPPARGTWRLPPLEVRSASGWNSCRHFHHCSTTGRVTRHRLSGFHSFRTAVVDEWVLRGEAHYDLQVEVLREPCALAVGAVTPAAMVNCDFGWAPGATGSRREHAWGYVMEARRGTPDDPAQGRQIWLGGSGTDGVERVTVCSSGQPLPAAQPGDTIHVRLSPTEAKIEITLRGISMGLALPEADAGQPLALAVGLKYASDSVILR